MSTIALPQIDGAGLLTHSRLQCKKRCARKHHYQYNLGIRKGDTAKPLRFGSAMHIGWECLAKGASFEDAVGVATILYNEVPAWAVTDEAVDEWLTERETVANLLAGYHWLYQDDPDIAEYIETEFAFDVEIRNPDTGAKSRTFRRAGKIDGIVRLKDGRLAVLEHKTCGEDIGPESDYWARLDIDEQISGYILAARQRGHDVETVLYDVARKPGIAPKQIPLLDERGLKIVLDSEGRRVLKENIKKNGEPGVGHGEPRQSGDAEKGWVVQSRTETPREFGERFLNDIVERPDFYFRRREIPRLQADLEEYEFDLWQQSLDMRESINTGRHFRNTGACLTMGRCEYLSLCKNGIVGDEVPAGFRRVDHVHPELLTGDE